MYFAFLQVFEFLDHDLGGLLNRGVEFKAAEIMCMSKQILTGMHYIHANKILHRDMKVANILMSSKGVRGLIFLCNFFCAARFGLRPGMFYLCAPFLDLAFSLFCVV